MAIELSNLMFTDDDDVVPQFGVEKILNTGIANILGGNDIITGTGGRYGFFNSGTLNTANGNDVITGIHNDPVEDTLFGDGIYNQRGTIYTGNGNDIITGIAQQGIGIATLIAHGIYHERGTIDTGHGNDIITGISKFVGIEAPYSIINTGYGNDTITGTAILRVGGVVGVGIVVGIATIEKNIFLGSLDTGHGNDIITGTGRSGIRNYSSIFTTGDGDDIITGNGQNVITELDNGNGDGIDNGGLMDTGDGNDIITGTNITGTNLGYGTGISNNSDITTGNGNDIITGTGETGIANSGTINTGNGKDIITSAGIFFNSGTINTGNGDDSIIANKGFWLNPSTPGSVFLGNGKDYLKGFGAGSFNGGNNKDTLELTSGSYTVGISGTAVNFTKNSNNIMETFEFEKLIAGSTTYNFASLTDGQAIFVA